MLWHHNATVNSHQRWKQTWFRVCFHLWCELISTMNVTERQVSWNSWYASWKENIKLEFCKLMRNFVFAEECYLVMGLGTLRTSLKWDVKSCQRFRQIFRWYYCSTIHCIFIAVKEFLPLLPTLKWVNWKSQLLLTLHSLCRALFSSVHCFETMHKVPMLSPI